MKYDDDYYAFTSVNGFIDDIEEEIPKLVEILELCKKDQQVKGKKRRSIKDLDC